jgi:hypothetical protein
MIFGANFTMESDCSPSSDSSKFMIQYRYCNACLRNRSSKKHLAKCADHRESDRTPPPGEQGEELERAEIQLQAISARLSTPDSPSHLTGHRLWAVALDRAFRSTSPGLSSFRSVCNQYFQDLTATLASEILIPGEKPLTNKFLKCAKKT